MAKEAPKDLVKTAASPTGEAEFLLYKTDDGRIRIETRLQNETIWLSLGQMAELFGVDKSGISRHLKNIFASGELQRDATVAKFATVQAEGTRQVARDLEHYNLDAIISVGYRVNSLLGTRFRIWATERIREYAQESGWRQLFRRAVGPYPRYPLCGKGLLAQGAVVGGG